MAVHKIESYVLRYDLEGNKPWIITHYKVSGSWRNESFYPPKEDAVYLSDMLRNEKPVYIVKTSTQTWLTTSSEEIGEEETP
jgi:formamidopyrimidine-DNA glycosylase